MFGKRFLKHLSRTYENWQNDDGHLLAAAVAYYAALAFFPLLLVLIAGLGVVLQWTAWGQDAQHEVLGAIGDYASPAVQQNVQTILNRVQQNAKIGGPAGLAALLFTAVALFAHFETAFDRIWNVEARETTSMWRTVRSILLHRLRAFLLLLALGILVLVIMVASVTLASLYAFTENIIPIDETLWQLIESAVTVLLNTGVFTLIYKILPKVPIHWREALRGALLTAIVWEAGRLVLTSFLIGDKYGAYGVVGAFIAVLLWIYYASTVLFLGAEYIQVICKDCDPKKTP